ncbi:MAG TPA: hypothetical protein VF132_03795 [Rudaea sp.]
MRSLFFDTGLAFVLFFPTFCIVGALYFFFPRQPRPRTRWVLDLIAILTAAACSLFAMRWGFAAATGVGSTIWRQVLATLMAYAAFFCVLAIALIARAAWLRAPRHRRVPLG